MTSKYRNKRTNGYASTREANVAANLHILARAGKILDLKEQVPFLLVPGKRKVRGITYIADFTYTDSDGTHHVLDAKGYRTDVYKLKNKLMYLLLDIEIEEV